MSTSHALSPKQTRAISALMTCRTLGEAAKAAGCGESSLRRWLAKDAHFQQAWREARAALVEEAVAHAQRSATAAVLVLHDRMLHAESDAGRIAAARSIVDISLKAVEREQLEQRIAALEDALAYQKEL